MARLASLVVNIGADTRGLKKGLDTGKKSLIGFQKSAISLRGTMVALAGAAGLAFAAKKVFDLGSAVEETASKFRTVFGPASDSVQGFIDDFATMAGLSNEAAQEVLATTGAIVQGMGFAQAASAKFAEEVVVLAGDLSSFNNIPIAATARAIQAALTGERESLKRLGVVILETDVQKRALIDTGKENAKALTQQEKAAATLALITERAGVAMGDLVRTQNSAANVARRVGARWQNLKETAATALLPTLAQLLGAIDDNRTAFDSLGTAITKTGAFMATLVTQVQLIGPALAVASAKMDVFIAKAEESNIGKLLGLGEGFGLLDPLGLDPIRRTLELFGKEFPSSVAQAEAALERMEIAAASVREEILTNLNRALAQTTDAEARTATEAERLKQSILDLLPPLRDELVSGLAIVSGGFQQVTTDIKETGTQFQALEEDITRTQSATISFATDFARRIGDATTRGREAFEGFFDSVIAGFARLAAEMAIFGLLESLLPNSSLVQNFGKSLGIKGKAHGGLVTAGQPYVVGERGPELFTPTRSGAITPAPETARILAVLPNRIREHMTRAAGGSVTVGRSFLVGEEGAELFTPNGNIAARRAASTSAPVIFNQTVNFNISAIDGASVAAMIEQEKGHIVAVVAEAAQSSAAFRRTMYSG